MDKLLALAAVASLGACTSAPYVVNQAGTVPAPRALAYDGQPLGKPMRVEGRMTKVLDHAEPRGNLDNNSGSYIARTHSDLALRGGRGNTDAGIELGLAWVRGSEASAPNLGPRPDADAAVSFVMAARHSFELADDLRLGAAFGFGFVTVPVALGGNTNPEWDEAGVFQLGLVPSYRTGPLVVFGGINFTSEVDVPRAIVADDGTDTPEAQASGGAVVLSAGATMTFDSGLRLTAQFARPTASAYADHGVQLDIGVGFEFGSRPPPRPTAPPPPPGYYPPPVYAPPPGGPAPGSPAPGTPAPSAPAPSPY